MYFPLIQPRSAGGPHWSVRFITLKSNLRPGSPSDVSIVAWLQMLNMQGRFSLGVGAPPMPVKTHYFWENHRWKIDLFWIWTFYWENLATENHLLGIMRFPPSNHFRSLCPCEYVTYKCMMVSQLYAVPELKRLKNLGHSFIFCTTVEWPTPRCLTLVSSIQIILWHFTPVCSDLHGVSHLVLE